MYIITFKTIATENNGLQVGKISKLSGKNSCKSGERQNYILLRQTNEFSLGTYTHIITIKKIRAEIKGLQVEKISELIGKTSCKIKERIIF